MQKRAVLCLAGRRDFFQAPWALREADLLEALVTDLYCDLKQVPVLRGLAAAWPKLGMFACPGLSPSDVRVSVRDTLRALVLRKWPARQRQIFHDRQIGRAARRLAEKTGAALFAYSYYASAAFEPGDGLPSDRILFQLHPHPASVRKLLREELERVPEAAGSLKWEHELGSPEEHFAGLCQEPLLANAWVVASSFTATTLAENGIPRGKIHVIPYGVDQASFPTRQSPPPRSQPLRLIWVGNLFQRKGLSYLLDAVGRFTARDVELVICTHHPAEMGMVNRRNLANVRVRVSLPVPAMIAQLHQADLFVLPSLAEGFAVAILEAMSAGLPVLTTPNTCGPDIIRDGENGFIVPIRDTDAIAQKIEWCINHREALAEMGRCAAQSVKALTWERFRKGLVEAYLKITAV
jgi:glycosyltransferase involved in cell wall biosynthesis